MVVYIFEYWGSCGNRIMILVFEWVKEEDLVLKIRIIDLFFVKCFKIWSKKDGVVVVYMLFF